ncbi:MAG TPA: sugar phosphate isomerase/epimerase, partial [Spirochaetia bacterium]|nr:sugar phosphate isomerase/epimerase [Spirochaetia bacterium]
MKKQNIVAQVYTVRDACNDAHGLADALARVRAIGYQAVEMSSVGPLPPKELARVLEGEGLTCAGTHEDSEELLADPSSVAERLAILGCTATAYPYPKGQDFSSLEAVKRLCKALERTGKTLKKAGISFSYHNHNLEFFRLGKSKVIDILLSETDDEAVKLELDTYWVQAGGGNPAEWIGKLKGRCSHLHIKDYGVDPKGRAMFEEIGKGNLDWDGIFAAAKKAGVKWYV